MITNFKIFENRESDEITVYLRDIYLQSPYWDKKMGNKYSSIVKKDYTFIINKLEEIFLNKYINFEHYFYSSGIHHTKLLHGIVTDIWYDNEYGDKRVYFKLKGDDSVYKVNDNSPIIINLIRSDAKKYNL